MGTAEPVWVILGGAGKGGIVVRRGQSTGSAAFPARLSTNARVKELELAGDRLRYERLSGDGPDSGWVTTRLGG
eukprot:CAMPEP_0168478906 /NCGR_PEP_ID=MMETSP0228-20121227/63197_1 /TAXON_ID=133427 /ORGANISM="Protoceratium reticulatum, Strain CCCM 535 (=CCMP 1889)" /LENGTH=73 /DNA_ID=CAMNT_0008495177 /DNA_START=34 /DNA_END=251 /DNA_ORIENTATION=-